MLFVIFGNYLYQRKERAVHMLVKQQSLINSNTCYEFMTQKFFSERLIKYNSFYTYNLHIVYKYYLYWCKLHH